MMPFVSEDFTAGEVRDIITGQGETYILLKNGELFTSG